MSKRLVKLRGTEKFRRVDGKKGRPGNGKLLVSPAWVFAQVVKPVKITTDLFTNIISEIPKFLKWDSLTYTQFLFQHTVFEDLGLVDMKPHENLTLPDWVEFPDWIVKPDSHYIGVIK